MADRERTGKQIFGELELADQGKFALTEPGGLGAFGRRLHLAVRILQEKLPSQQNPRVRK
jgi:hypothetical protein